MLTRSLVKSSSYGVPGWKFLGAIGLSPAAFKLSEGYQSQNRRVNTTHHTSRNNFLPPRENVFKSEGNEYTLRTHRVLPTFGDILKKTSIDLFTSGTLASLMPVRAARPSDGAGALEADACTAPSTENKRQRAVEAFLEPLQTLRGDDAVNPPYMVADLRTWWRHTSTLAPPGDHALTLHHTARTWWCRMVLAKINRQTWTS